MLLDRFGRVIDYLRISITDRCNLRCQYCTESLLPFIPHADILSLEEIIRITRVAASLGVRKVRLTGGEPLRRKGLAFLIKEINDIPPIEDIGITTNGVELAEHIEELKNAGLKRINVSLDTFKPERFAFITGVDAFDRVLNSISKAQEVGFHPIKINTVIIRDFNHDEVLDFADFAVKQRLQVRFIEFMPFVKSLWDSSKVFTSAQLEEIIRGKYDLEPVSGKMQRGPAKMFHIKGSEGQIGFISPISTHICHECNRIRLTPDGKIKPCLFSEIEHDIKSFVRSGASNKQIADFLRMAVQSKPERKVLEGGSIRRCQRSMRRIGG